jgi:hypothetical protein
MSEFIFAVACLIVFLFFSKQNERKVIYRYSVLIPKHMRKVVVGLQKYKILVGIVHPGEKILSDFIDDFGFEALNDWLEVNPQSYDFIQLIGRLNITATQKISLIASVRVGQRYCD